MKHVLAVSVSLIALIGFAILGRTSSVEGAQIIQAASPEGQLISFVYQAKGQLVVCGIRVQELETGQGLDNNGLFTSVKDMKLASNNMECAFGPADKQGNPQSLITTFKAVDFSSGHILMTVAAAQFSEPNGRFRLTLTSMFKGTMVPVRAKSAVPAKPK